METKDRNIIVELENGTKIGLRVNNWALRETQRKSGCKGIVELFHKIGVDDGNIDMQTFIILLMEAVNEYNIHQGNKDIEINERIASGYVDEMGGIINALKKISEGLIQYVPKNVHPPQQTGEVILQ